MMRNRHLYITILSLLGLTTEAQAQAIARAPQLVVAITIDNLRTDYLETYAPLYQQGGLKQLIEEGIVFANASCLFTPADHASATASLATGTTPYYNGVTGEEWLNRNTLQPESIVQESTPAQLATSTLGDELKMASNGTALVFAFAKNVEDAILSAGHAADGAMWLTGTKWTAAACYKTRNKWFAKRKQQEPAKDDANEQITDMALQCIEQSGIGLHGTTDLLNIAYAVKDETMDYRMLDYHVARLLTGIYRRLSRESVLIVLTGTGSTTEEKQAGDYERYNIPTGKFYINRTANLLNLYLGAIYGSGQYVETSWRNQLFLNHKLISQKNLNLSDILRQSQEFVLQMSGVRNVYSSIQLQTSDSQTLLRIRNGYNTEKSGDLLIDIAPGWQLINEDTHSVSTSRIENTPFPIIFYGGNIKAQRIASPVTIDRIAPTLARAIRIRAPNACRAEPLF